MLVIKGIIIKGLLLVLKGYCGFVGEYCGCVLLVYLLLDGEYMVIGLFYDCVGNDFISDVLEVVVVLVLDEIIWIVFGKMCYIVEGVVYFKCIVYVFIDIECLYCYKLWVVI